MKASHSLTLALALMLGLGLVACDKEKAPEGTATAPSTTATTTASVVASTTASAAPTAMKPHRRGPRGLAAMMLKAAEEKVPDAKATVADLQKKLQDGDTPRDEMKTIHETMVAGIKAGKIDLAKLDADQAAADKAMKAHKDKEAETLNALHAALKPEQRKAVVAEVREDMKKHAEKMDKWKSKDGSDGKPGDKAADGDKGDPKMAHRAKMTKDLDLDADQQKKVDAIFANGDPKAKADHDAMKDAMKKKMDTFFESFEKDTFDAKKLEQPKDGGKMMMMGPMDLKKMNEVLAILKPEQREKLATKMDHKGDHKGGNKMKAPGDPPAAADDDDDDDTK